MKRKTNPDVPRCETCAGPGCHNLGDQDCPSCGLPVQFYRPAPTVHTPAVVPAQSMDAVA